MGRLFATIFLIAFLWTQKELESLEKKNQRLKEDVENLKGKIAEFTESKDRVLYQLKESYYNIRLAEKNAKITSNQITLFQKKIILNRKNIQKIKSEQTILRRRFATRLVASYKTPPISLYEIIINSKTVEEIMRFLKYKEILDTEEKKLFNKLLQNEGNLSKIDKLLRQDIQRKEIALFTQKMELKKLSKLRAKQKQIQNKIMTNIAQAKKAIKEKEWARKEAESLIRNLLRRSKSTTKIYKLSRAFKKNKGKFNWPLKGKVISRFGRIKHPKFNIYSQNNGIDIKAKRGDFVRSIHEGLIININYLPGLGNSIFIDHGNGFISIYTHLDDIYVEPDQMISARGPIGSAGNSGSLDGKTKLHFEIWSKNKALNPIKWLK